MSITDHQCIAFGPGEKILQVPENEQLLEQIRETPIVSPAGLSKLSTFFRAYTTNEPLANHLALVGLMALVQCEPDQRSLTKTTEQVSQQSFFDFWEDYFDNALDEFTEPASTVKAVDVDNALDEFTEPASTVKAVDVDNALDEFTEPASTVKAVDVKWVLLSGVGLLIETPEISGGPSLHYVIGVSPDPASLPPN